MLQRDFKIPPTACLRARLIIPALKQQLLQSRDRQEAVLFALQLVPGPDAGRFPQSNRSGSWRLIMFHMG